MLGLVGSDDEQILVKLVRKRNVGTSLGQKGAYFCPPTHEVSQRGNSRLSTVWGGS